MTESEKLIPMSGIVCVADISQLVCLSNLENLNAHFIYENLTQQERLQKLNLIAIHQMKLLTKDLGLTEIEETK